MKMKDENRGFPVYKPPRTGISTPPWFFSFLTFFFDGSFLQKFFLNKEKSKTKPINGHENFSTAAAPPRILRRSAEIGTPSLRTPHGLSAWVVTSEKDVLEGDT